MQSTLPTTVLCMAGMLFITTFQSLCMVATASPVFLNLTGADIHVGWTTDPVDDHNLVQSAPFLDRAYYKAIKKGEKRWADAISPSAMQRTGNFLRWDALVVEETNENMKPGPSGKQLAAKNSGWKVNVVQSKTNMDDVTRDYTAALNGAQLTTENSKNIAMVHEGTDARYKGLYSPSNGLIIAYERHSPQYQAETHTHVNPSDIPEITQWSDVAFLAWMHTISELGLTPAEAPLKQIFIGPITNTESRDVIKKAIREASPKGEELPPFEKAVVLTKPGPIVQEKDEPFMAVLGTDDLAGVGYLLAQHREQLGKKEIGSLVVFGKGENLCVKVEVVDQK